MKLNKKLASIVLAILAVLAIIAQGGDMLGRLSVTGSLKLPSSAILSEPCVPLLSSSDRVGFVPIVTDGALVSFDTNTGNLISSVVVGHNAGLVSMVEVAGKRLVAVPTGNSPDRGLPATVSVIDATDPAQLLPLSLIVLPATAHFDAGTRALLTADGRFVVVASSYPDPILYSFDTTTGLMVSSLPLIGPPSRLALQNSSPGTGADIAIVSAAANTLTMAGIRADGELTEGGSFSPADASFGEWNNPAFGYCHNAVYVAAATGSELFAVDPISGALIDSIPMKGSPQIVSVAPNARGDLIAVTRIKGKDGQSVSGVSLFANAGGRLSPAADFTPPDGTVLARSNNVAFSDDGRTGFIGSDTGSLFAFDTTSGGLESQEDVGGELMGVSVSFKQQSAAVVRRKPTGDEIVVVGLDLAGDTSNDSAAGPTIKSLDPGVVEQGQLKQVRLTVHGSKFVPGSVILYGGSNEAKTARLSSKLLTAKLPQPVFDQAGNVSIQVKAPDGTLSNAATLQVVPPQSPTIKKLSPAKVPGPHAAFDLTVTGSNFRPTSMVFVGQNPLNTDFVNSSKLTTHIPKSIARTVQDVDVQVVDAAVPGVASNTVQLSIFGPTVSHLTSSRHTIIAGSRGFNIEIRGKNFQAGSTVQVNGVSVSPSDLHLKSATRIKAYIHPKFFQDAGVLSFIVQNPDGSSSTSTELNALAPEITSFNPGAVIAGLTDVKMAILGSNFRRNLTVNITDGDGASFKVPTHLVRFASRTRVIVTLSSKKLNKLISTVGTLNVQVVNPNNHLGVPSVATQLSVAAPEVDTVAVESDKPEVGDSRIVIKGKYFVAGATVQVLKDGGVVLQPAALSVSSGKIIAAVRSRKLIVLGQYTVRVVNPSNIPSNDVAPQ